MLKPIKNPSQFGSIKDKTEQVKKLAGTDRIAKWFSQAGIYSVTNAKQNQSIDLQNKWASKIKRTPENYKFRKWFFSKAINFCLDDGQTDDIDPDWCFSVLFKMAEEI